MNVVVTNSIGTEVLNTNLTLAAKSTQHFVLDGFLTQGLGLAKVQAVAGAEVMVTNMQYGRTPTAGLSNIYPIPARESLGTIMQGSYNTFLQQDCSLLLGNVSNSPENVTIDLTRFDGTMVLAGQAATVPANGVLEFNACAVEPLDNVFGVVRVNTTNTNTIVGNVVRLGLNDNYRIATPVR